MYNQPHSVEGHLHCLSMLWSAAHVLMHSLCCLLTASAGLKQDAGGSLQEGEKVGLTSVFAFGLTNFVGLKLF